MYRKFLVSYTVNEINKLRLASNVRSRSRVNELHGTIGGRSSE